MIVVAPFAVVCTIASITALVPAAKCSNSNTPGGLQEKNVKKHCSLSKALSEIQKYLPISDFQTVKKTHLSEIEDIFILQYTFCRRKLKEFST
jgi:hypothetical protein